MDQNGRQATTRNSKHTTLSNSHRHLSNSQGHTHTSTGPTHPRGSNRVTSTQYHASAADPIASRDLSGAGSGKNLPKRKHQQGADSALFAVDATDPARQLHVLYKDGDALGMDGTEIAILKEVHEVGFGRLLKRQNGLTLPTVRLRREHVLHLAHQARERQLADEQLCRLLVRADLADGALARP
eukprot:CAMPEP_0118870870 /NCGR_PEP_ID=MMETSP1163-20130328/13668_1 /TAXON_ID=124430 /ORGANISM="Phaeomonas parva, Strain CCMP2877" /LENGTH=183 /DNA_ID=CAMNT_0006805911 /DNA_START=184 /DNA_END=731 /DNA_ORIENTATION=-